MKLSFVEISNRKLLTKIFCRKYWMVKKQKKLITFVELRRSALREAGPSIRKSRSDGEPLATVHDMTGSGIKPKTSRTHNDVFKIAVLVIVDNGLINLDSERRPL